MMKICTMIACSHSLVLDVQLQGGYPGQLTGDDVLIVPELLLVDR